MRQALPLVRGTPRPYSAVVPIWLDHVAVPVRSPEAAARFLGSLLGIEPTVDGPDGELGSLRLDADAMLLFMPAEAPVFSHHVALRVDPKAFDEVVTRLRARAIAFGNDPEDPMNGCWGDPLGGHGRVYFADPDGHFFEVCA